MEFDGGDGGSAVLLGGGSDVFLGGGSIISASSQLDGGIHTNSKTADEYAEIASNVKKNAFTKNVADLGYEPVSYGWNNNYHKPGATAKKGKVETLRAVIPSIRELDVPRSRPQSAPFARNHEEDFDARMECMGIDRNEFFKQPSTALPKTQVRYKKSPQKHAEGGRPERPQSAGIAGRLARKTRPVLSDLDPNALPAPPRRKSVVDGVKYVYDIHGRLVPLSKQNEATEEIRQRMTLRESQSARVMKEMIVMAKSNKIFDPECDLIQKTKEWAAQTHQWKIAESMSKERFQWTPMALPCTTFTTDDNEAVLPMHAVKYWPEYGLMESDDVIVTIEHCSGCDKHEQLCHHDEERYKKVAEAMRVGMVEVSKLFAIRYAVLVKPHKAEHKNPFDKGGYLCGTITKGRDTRHDRWQLLPGMPNVDRHKDGTDERVMGVDYSHRMGSMEIQVAVHAGLGRELVTHILHSKILHGLWPDLEEIQERFIKVLRHQRMLQVRDEVPKKKLDFTISKNVTAVMIAGTNQMMLQDNARPDQSNQSPGKRKKKKRASLNVNGKKPPPPKPPLVVPWDKDAKVLGRTNKTLSMRVLGFHRADDVDQRTYSPTTVGSDDAGPETDRSSASAHSPHRFFLAGLGGAKSPVKHQNNDYDSTTKNNTTINTTITTANHNSNNSNSNNSSPSQILRTSLGSSSVKFADDIVIDTASSTQPASPTMTPAPSSSSASSSSLSTHPLVRNNTDNTTTTTTAAAATTAAASSSSVSLTDRVEVLVSRISCSELKNNTESGFMQLAAANSDVFLRLQLGKRNDLQTAVRENAGAAVVFNYQQQQQTPAQGAGHDRVEKDQLRWGDLTVADLLDKDALKLVISVWDHYKIRAHTKIGTAEVVGALKNIRAGGAVQEEEVTFEGVLLRNDKQETTGKVTITLAVRVNPSAATTTTATIKTTAASSSASSSSSSAVGNVPGRVSFSTNQQQQQQQPPVASPQSAAVATTGTGTGTTAATTTPVDGDVTNSGNALSARPAAPADSTPLLAPSPVVSAAAPAPSVAQPQPGPGLGLGPPLETAKHMNFNSNNNSSSSAAAADDGKAADEFFENYEGEGDGFDQDANNAVSYLFSRQMSMMSDLGNDDDENEAFAEGMESFSNSNSRKVVPGSPSTVVKDS